MNRGTSTRSGRVPLSSRGNVTNIDNGVNAKVTKKNGLGTILPSKKDSRPVSFAAAVPLPTTTTTLLRQSSTTTTTSMASGSTGGGGVSAVSDNNRAFDSLSSDTLRQVIGTTNILNNIVGNDDFDAGVGIGSGMEKKGSSAKQPLGGSSMMNQHQLLHNNNDVPSGVVKPSSTSTVISSLTATSSSSSEPITIIEHRKRPCGNGHTVHTYLRGKLLGKGGFAKVYKVTSLDTNKEYAVKVVPKANLVKSRARQKLQTEIKIHRTMKHANICEYKHFFEDMTNCYILLELCHNQSMNEMIKRRKCLTEEETRLLMLQMVDAVTFMHDSNVIHRDLKLGNLFLSKTMNIKVGDFGLACRVDSSDEKRRTICGTPNYIAPEVIEGNKEKRGHSFEVDVWSMGVVCYTMLVGKPPYESTDVKSTYKRILSNEYSFPQGKVSCDARLLIAAMLQTDPKMRLSLDEIRKHPFFTMHQIPRSLPSTCTVSAPIWSTDEFGELNAIRPTSALDVPDNKTSSSTQLHKATVGETPVKISVVNASAKKSVPVPKAGASAVVGGGGVCIGSAFNIYDDVSTNHQAVEVQLLSCPEEVYEPKTSVMPMVMPMHMLADQLASCHVHDEVRDLPPHPRVVGLWSSPTNPFSPTLSNTNELGSTPTNAVLSQPSYQSPPSTANNDDSHELVMMHDRLDECLINYERVHNGGFKAECPLIGGEVWGSKRYVVRYVDYTSKYGLGFLFNDGSSGVYFNDSTRAVHSVTNDTFVYIERRGGSGVGVDREPVSIHTLTNFPDDLKKKVTLLQHFRSYLLEQQKKAEEAGEAEPLSSSNYDETRQDTDNCVTTTCPKVYMKKWIKTKHAMLFRLSNGTVQVLFYDMTEVLISSEGKLITYVDKDKNRFVHSIAEIANKQHSDISRRLKYAKEILSQLISASKR